MKFCVHLKSIFIDVIPANPQIHFVSDLINIFVRNVPNKTKLYLGQISVAF